MQIQDWGEENFVEYLAKQFPFKDPTVGIGDDCAAIPIKAGMIQLVTTDALVEGIHFIKDQIPAHDLGFKAIAVNVSDITAKGGVPKYAFLSIALPSNTECNWLKNVIEGIRQACTKWDIQLLGGDTVGSKRDLFLNVTLLGTASQIKYRHLAKAGDIVCVTGYLGNSGAGLKALQENIHKTDEVKSLIHSHFHPEPSPQEGIWLSNQKGVHAMMDVSDGLDCDLNRLIKASQCGATIDISKLPLSNALLHTCQNLKWDPVKFALTGGEDYCLLVTIDRHDYAAISAAFNEQFGHPLSAFGEITDQRAQTIYHLQGKAVEVQLRQFTHFQ